MMDENEYEHKKMLKSWNKIRENRLMKKQKQDSEKQEYVMDTGFALFDLGTDYTEAVRKAQRILNNPNHHHYGDGKIYKQTKRVSFEYSKCVKKMKTNEHKGFKNS